LYKIPKILSVLDSTKVRAVYVRPVQEGEEVFQAVLVISVGIKQKEGNIRHIKALVLRNTGITTQHLYLLEIRKDLKEYGQREIKKEKKSAECECKAGESAKC